ncbi:MAG: SDR family oxidoreductase [Acetobacteraceae bacterium]|jgi:3-oxoacyl-[acyl-carrier protein] reductase
MVEPLGRGAARRAGGEWPHLPGPVPIARVLFFAVEGGHHGGGSPGVKLDMQIRFDDKIVAVTGAGHGFGRAIARRFASLGAHVFATDVVEASLAETARSQTAPIDAGAPGRITAEVVDLRDRAAGAAWIAGIERATGGPIDVLVNNAGGVAGQTNRPIEEVPDADWDVIFDIGVNAAFVLCRAAAPGMKRRGSGRIVNISSGAGLQASLTGVQAYCASKHAVVGLTRQLAHEFGPFGITVNSVAPGFIRTNEATERQWQSYGPEGQRALVDRIAMKRLGSADDIASAVVFFASDLAGFVNGQILQVDGGR